MAVLQERWTTADKVWNEDAVKAMLQFADAEAAALREEAAQCAEREVGLWGINPGIDGVAKVIAANIRALPATGEVGRG